jgi:hypothetical protein
LASSANLDFPQHPLAAEIPKLLDLCRFERENQRLYKPNRVACSNSTWGCHWNTPEARYSTVNMAAIYFSLISLEK